MCHSRLFHFSGAFVKDVNGRFVTLPQIHVVEAQAEFFSGFGRLEVVETSADLNNPASAQSNLSVMQSAAEIDHQVNLLLGQALFYLVQLLPLLINRILLYSSMQNVI